MMEKTAPRPSNNQGKSLDFAPKLSAAISSFNPKEIDSHIYRQVAIFVGLAVLIAAGLFAYLWVGQEQAVRRQLKKETTSSADKTENLEQRQASFKDDQQRILDVNTLNSALKSYYLKENSLPASLKELVPDYLAKMPLDPKTKKEYTYIFSADQKSWQLKAVLSDGKEFVVKGP